MRRIPSPAIGPDPRDLSAREIPRGHAVDAPPTTARTPARFRRTAGWFLIGLALVGTACPHPAPRWGRFVSLRTTGSDLRLGGFDPQELIQGKISRKLHYASMALETVFYRDLPTIEAQSHIVLCATIQGVLPGGRVIKTVADLTQARGKNGYFFFDNAIVIEPFLYTGLEVVLTLSFRRAEPAEAQSIRGRIRGVRDLLRKINPLAAQALQTAGDVYAAVSSAFAPNEPTWTHRLSLLPADGIIVDKPENLFTAARHVLIAPPLSAAAGKAPPVSVSTLRKELQVRAGRLVWRKDGRPYEESPYLILNITRYRRYPNPETELAKLRKQREAVWSEGNFLRVRELQREISAAVVRDPIITIDERNLERAWVDVWDARLRSTEARKQGNLAVAHEQALRQARLLVKLKRAFRHVLEPFEVRDLIFQLGKVRDRVAEIRRELRRRAESDAATRMNPVARLLDLEKRREASLARDAAAERLRVQRFFAPSSKASGPVPRPTPGWVETEAAVELGAGTPTARARALALLEARRLAVRNVAGERAGTRYVGGTATDLESRSVVERLERLIGDGLIISEKVLAEGARPTPTGGGSRYWVRLRARVAFRAARIDPGYRLNLKLSNQNLREGDEVSVTATVSRDSYLFVLGVAADGEVTVVVPNAFLPVPFVKAGQPFVFPGPKLTAAARIVARLPRGATTAVERLKVIAVRRKLAILPPRARNRAIFRSFDGKSPLLLSHILGRLSSIDPDLWVDGTAQYTIRAR